MAIKQYRTEYTGEFVITNTIFKGGKKEQEREWIDNPITNESINHRACCIAPGASIEKFPMVRLQEHRGGLLSKNKMQLYGCEEIWEQMNSDFLVVLEQDHLDAIKEANYQVDHIVYTTTRLCINNPGEFYLVPHGTNYVTPATALWIACFDGHKDIYLFGYDVYTDGVEKTKVIEAVNVVMKTYNDVNFYHVCDDGTTPDKWRCNINLEVMSQRDFVSYCDI